MADLQATVEWAETNRRLWAFSDRNAGAGYANFFNDLNSLNQLDWAAVEANDFRDGDVKEGKQAEFLIHESLPWHLVKQIGVASAAMKGLVDEILGDSPYRPPVAVEKTWYY